MSNSINAITPNSPITNSYSGFIKEKTLKLYQKITNIVSIIFNFFKNFFIEKEKKTIINQISPSKKEPIVKIIDGKKTTLFPDIKKIECGIDEGTYIGNLNNDFSGKDVTITWSPNRQQIGTFEKGLLIEGKLKVYDQVSEGKFENGKLVRGSYKTSTYESKGTYLNEQLHCVEGYERDITRNVLLKGTFKNGVLIEGQINNNGNIAFIDPSKEEDATHYKTLQSYKNRSQPFKLTLSDGSIEEGEIKNQEKIIKKITKADGSFYEGTFKNDCLDGKYVCNEFTCVGRFIIEKFYEDNRKVFSFIEGTKTLNKTNEIQTGFFKNEVLEGPGKVEFIDGTIFECHFKSGQPKGQGTVKLNSEILHTRINPDIFNTIMVQFIHPHDKSNGILQKTMYVNKDCYTII